MKASATLLTFAAAAGLASAQTLSTDCMNSFKAVIASPDAACLNPSSLLSFFVGNQQSVPDTVNNWLSGLCSTGFCSNDTLATVVNNITTGCQKDFGLSGGVPDTVVQIVQEVYPTARSIMCLKDDSTNQLCVTETLTNLQDIVGKLSFSDFNIATAFGDFQKILVGAKNLACTGCTKAAFRLASQLSLVTQFPQAQQQAALQIDAICGANFIESSSSDSGDNVSQTAINEAFSTKSNSALSMTTSKVAGALMLFFFSAFTLLG
ncbi:hypothetical protein MVEN_00523100 [Mycena venus]|uniref:DUF7729 domain-containing protein n=1 Tax=Mycena venus TaxID=2733690 RepID=A0A8H6YNV7_9AGAR|nr:hypothetical protein MVEN_00523100 [Mycena venus]